MTREFPYRENSIPGPKPRRAIRIRLALFVSLLLGTISLFIFYYLPYTLEQQALHAIADKAQSIASMTAYNISPALFFGDVKAADEAFHSALQSGDVVYIVARDESGKAFDAHFNGKAGEEAYHEYTSSGHVSADGTVFSTSAPILHNGKKLGTLILGISLNSLKKEIHDSRAAIAILSLVLFIISILVVFTIITITTKPLSDIVETVEQIASGDLSRRAPVATTDEIGHLASSFNLMVDHLTDAQAALEKANKNLEHRVEERTKALQREIIEREQAEEALRASEERYRRFFEEDLSGNFIATVNGRILACNSSFVRIFGFSSVDAVLASNLRLLFPYETAMDDLFELLRRHRKLVYHEAELRRADASTLSVIENVIGTFDDEGRLVEVEGYVYDNTSLKKLEDEFRQAQKMESIGTLAGGIAHDFNNILAIIVGYTSLLLGDNTDRGKFQKWVETIRDAAERGSGLVRQLLTFAQKDTVRVDRIDVNDVISDVVKMLAETFPKTITFETNFGRDVKNIYADHSQLHQTMLNLCVNARDAMPDGGVIAIATGTMEGTTLRQLRSEAQASQYVFIKVTDNGTGINETTRTRIFEPFFTTKERGRGTGLGLAVVYGVMKSLNGFVEVTSEVGQGTTFTLFFPVSEGVLTEVENIKQPNGKTEGGNETLLIVEDEEKLVELLQTFLGAAGYHLLSAKDGEEAIELYKRKHQNIAFVLIDVDLPKLSGNEVYLKMKKLNPDVKAVLASGNIEPAVLRKMNAEGICGFLPKPYDLGQILRKIREVLDAPNS